MTTIVLSALVQVLTLGANQQDFDEACQQSLTTQHPLVVLVGANWCAGLSNYAENDPAAG